MARRNSSFIDLLFLLPWWFNALLSVASYYWLKFYLPEIDFESPIYQGMSRGLSQIAGIISGFIALIAVINFCKVFHRKFIFMLVSGGGFLSSLFKRIDYAPSFSVTDLSWREFEILVGEMYRQAGYRVIDQGGSGSDGGIDLILKRDNETTIVQCKHWLNKKIGVKVIREMYGVMIAENANKVFVICSGEFTRDAKAFADGKPIDLISGDRLNGLINDVILKRNLVQNTVHSMAINNNELIPLDRACKCCGNIMVKRTAKQGQFVGQEFWGCSTYPKCRNIEH